MQIEPEQSFQYLLDPRFDMSAFDEETLAGIGLAVVQTKTNSQQLIGKLAIAQEKLTKRGSMKAFASALQISFSSLRAYKCVEERLEGLEVPADYTWGARAVLAAQDNPKKVLAEAIVHGLSSAEFVRTFSKTKEEKYETVTCPNCHKIIEI